MERGVVHIQDMDPGIAEKMKLDIFSHPQTQNLSTPLVYTTSLAPQSTTYSASQLTNTN